MARPSNRDPTSTRSSADRHRRDGARAHAPADRAASLVIVPGDRVDVIGAIVGRARRRGGRWRRALGLVLTGGYRPPEEVLHVIQAADIFATIVPEDTYTVASELHDLLVKTHPADHEKIAQIKALLGEYLYIDRFLEVADEARLD